MNVRVNQTTKRCCRERFTLAFVLQDLRCALQKTRSELQAKEAALKESEAERHTVVQEKDISITQLKHSLQEKERQLEVTRGVPHTCIRIQHSMQLHIYEQLSDPCLKIFVSVGVLRNDGVSRKLQIKRCSAGETKRTY